MLKKTDFAEQANHLGFTAHFDVQDDTESEGLTTKPQLFKIDTDQKEAQQRNISQDCSKAKLQQDGGEERMG